MRVFLTGGTGYSGPAIIEGLVREGHEIRLLVSDSTQAASVAGASSITPCIGRMGSLHPELLADCDTLIHHAIWWDEEPTEYELQDLRATVDLFRGAIAAGVRHIVFTSSVAVHRPFAGVMNEATATPCTDGYGATKLAGEAFLNALAQETGIDRTILRLGPIVGAPIAGNRFKSNQRLREMVRAARRGEPLRGDTGGRQFLPLDALGAIYARCVGEAGPRGVYLCMAGKPTSWLRVAQIVLEECESASDVEMRSGPSYSFDVSKFEREFAIPLTAEQALREHVRYLVQDHCPEG